MNIELSHVAIAVPELETIEQTLQSLALKVESTHTVPSERVTAAMVPVKVSKEFRLEFLSATDSDSPIAKFLEKRPAGGLHHICFSVHGIDKWKAALETANFIVLPPGIRKGARGKVLFIHPKCFYGVLVELEELS